MAIFGNTNVRSRDLELSLTNILILVIMTMVVVQAIGLVFSGSWGASIKLGPAFVLIAIAMSAALSIVVFKKMANDQEVTQKDIFAIVVVTGIALVLLFFLRDFVPEIFEQGVVGLQSMLGFM